MASASQISHRNLGRQSWASAPTGRRESPIDRPGQRRTAERLRRGCKGWAEGAAEITPKSVQQPRTIPQSRSLAATAPFAQGSLALRGTGERADTRVRPYVVIGIASSARRGGTEPAPYGSTGSAGLRADVPKAWPLPPKFRSEIWGVGHRHRPLRKDGNPDLLVPRGAATSHPCDSGMVSSKGRASALPLVVSRGAGEKFEIPQIFSWGSPLIDSGPLPAGRTAPAGRGISPRPEGDAACQASSGSQSLFSLQKPRGID